MLIQLNTGSTQLPLSETSFLFYLDARVYGGDAAASYKRVVARHVSLTMLNPNSLYGYRFLDLVILSNSIVCLGAEMNVFSTVDVYAVATQFLNYVNSVDINDLELKRDIDFILSTSSNKRILWMLNNILQGFMNMIDLSKSVNLYYYIDILSSVNTEAAISRDDKRVNTYFEKSGRWDHKIKG
ncbi:MAG: hypothetical protein ACRC92_27140 [Peptostreptococcaceae bacterium]